MRERAEIKRRVTRRKPVNDRNDQPTTQPAPDTKPTAYDLAQRIAQYMTSPDRWTAKRRITPDGEELPQSADLVRDLDGAGISLYLGGYRNEARVAFRSTWPKYGDGRSYAPRAYLSITCSAERPPKALAQEIERRLLADYGPAYRAALDAISASDAAAAEAWRAAERIARCLGAEVPSETSHVRRHNGDAVESHGGPPKVYRLKVHPAHSDSPTSVSFEVHNVDVETTLRAMALLAGKSEPNP
jgi:hypothetical protein